MSGRAVPGATPTAVRVAMSYEITKVPVRQRRLQPNDRNLARALRAVAPALIVGGLVCLQPAAPAQQTITRTYTYDANGALLSRSDGQHTDRYAFDARQKLVGAAVDAAAPVVATYRYDADGQRSGTITPVRGTHHLVDTRGPTGVSQILEQRDGAGNLAATYTIGSRQLAVRTPTFTNFYHRDGQRSTRSLSGPIGRPTDDYVYEAFGQLRRHTGGSFNTVLYQGEHYDVAVGVYDLRARLYDPEHGRFTSSDPFLGTDADPTSYHKYLYCAGDPVNRSDPTGLFSVAELMVTVGVLGVVNTLELSSAEGASAASLCEVKAQIAQKAALTAAREHRAGFFANYIDWFGFPEASSVAHVEASLDAVIRKLSDRIDFEVAQGSCFIRAPEAAEALAFAFPSLNRIRLCKGFCDGSISRDASRVLYHEAHHLAIGATGPEVYGADACRRLALDDPHSAVRNADSFSFAVFGDVVMLDVTVISSDE